MGWGDTINTGWLRLRAMLRPRPNFVPLGEYAVARTWRGDRLFLSARDLGMTPYIATSGKWEPGLERLLGRLLRPGQVVVECGANVGYHTLAMGHAVGPAGRIHAFEAHPRVAMLLARTIGMAGFADRVTLHEQAVADRPGTLRFLADPYNTASGHLAWEGSSALYSEAYDVAAVRLDDVLAELPRTDLLRMDIEGAEGLALLGATELLRRSPGVRIVTEWDPVQMRARSDVAVVADRLASAGFRAAVIGRDGTTRPIEMATLPGLSMANLLLTRPG